jgi:hypothetical protein
MLEYRVRLLLTTAALLAAAAPAALAAGTTERVSVSSTGVQGNGDSGDNGLEAVSPDGRFVAFDSAASNLVKSDTNGKYDVFVRDLQAGTTERVSVSSSGAQATGASFGSLDPSISAHGHFVAFFSDATDLVPGDTNGATDIFVRDRAKGTTERVSVGPHGRQANGDSGVVGAAISADGRFVVFPSDATDLVEGSRGGGLYVRDRQAGTTERVDLGPHGVPGNGSSDRPAISAGGRVVAFDSDATNLVPGDTNGKLDVFVRAGLATAATAETAAR